MNKGQPPEMRMNIEFVAEGYGTFLRRSGERFQCLTSRRGFLPYQVNLGDFDGGAVKFE
jgi:hypothetical protein